MGNSCGLHICTLLPYCLQHCIFLFVCLFVCLFCFVRKLSFAVEEIQDLPWRASFPGVLAGVVRFLHDTGQAEHCSRNMAEVTVSVPLANSVLFMAVGLKLIE